MDLTMATTDELLAQKERIEAELMSRIDEELENIEQRRAQLLAMKPAAKPTKKKRGQSSMPARYRNPNDPSQTWTGRGKPPAWIAGIDRESCLIPLKG